MDDVIDCENSFVNCYRAQQAWWDYNDDLSDLDHNWHVRKGFMDGYKETAENGPSSSSGHCQNEQCLPLMPPRCYWKHCYQNCEGRQKIDAWYQGYAHGAMAASQDGAYEFSVIPTYGLHNGTHQPGASHTSSLEEDLIYEEHDQLVPEPDRVPSNSEDLLPSPETYDGLPKVPPPDNSAPESPVSGASYQYFDQASETEWASQSAVLPARNSETPSAPIDLKIPTARFAEVTTQESAAEEDRTITPSEFVLPVGYEGFRAPEWSEGANRE